MQKTKGRESAGVQSTIAEGIAWVGSESEAKRFGPWRYDAIERTLTFYEGERWGYEVDLDRMQTCAAMLDWIFQVRGKSWCTPEAMAGLLEALDEIFDPQSGMCRGGVDRGPSGTKETRRANVA